MDLERSSRFIGVFMIILGAIVVIGAFLTLSEGTISFLLVGLDVEYTPLFGELELTFWDLYSGDFLINYLLYEAILNELFSNVFSNIVLSSSSSIYSILIIILGGVVALIGILEATERISLIVVVLTLILGVALIVLPIVEYYTFKNEILEEIYLFYFIGGRYIDYLFPWSIVFFDPILLFFMEKSATVGIGFYIIVIPASVITLISLIAIVSKDR